VRAKVKQYHSGEPQVVPGYADEGVWIECEIIAPYSVEGRSVDLYIPADLVAPVMKELRGALIRARQEPDPQGKR